MKKMLPISILFIVIFSGCVSTTPDLEPLSSSYDGTWEGYTVVPEGRFDIKMEIKDGIMSGFVEDTKIKGYIYANKKFVIGPVSIAGAQVRLDVNRISPDRIEGTVISVSFRDKWFVVKK